ncbi:MAG: SMP-30/gluconolactonase/LRE family protein [Gemmatimonadales bacterium]|nr:SMP-30/gluconolactonase/LRE family protein [Gemmatimonadales bacterium]MBP6572410.1 SMP-30/gluconolactonase/LRE family protein [Gemmatimonadales bacterium]
MRLFLALTLLPLVAAPAQTLVITNKNESTASIITLADGKTVATLPTGNAPHEVAVSRDGKWAVATDYGAAGPGGTTLTVIDVAARKVARTITFGTHVRPHGAAFLPDHRTLVVTAERGGALVLVDVVAGTIVREEPTGQMVGHMVALSPDSKTAYVANINPGTLSIVDLAGDTPPAVVKVGTMTEAIAASPDGKMVWMGSNNTGKVFVVDLAKRAVVDSVQTSGFPYRIGFTPDSRTAIVNNPMSNEIWIFDAQTRAVKAKIAVVDPDGGNAAPFGLIVSPKGGKAWITMNGVAKVAELDIATATLTRWMATGAGPDGIGLVP